VDFSEFFQRNIVRTSNFIFFEFLAFFRPA